MKSVLENDRLKSVLDKLFKAKCPTFGYIMLLQRVFVHEEEKFIKIGCRPIYIVDVVHDSRTQSWCDPVYN